MKEYLIIYESKYGNIFKKVYSFTSQKEALEDFKEKNTKYGYKIIAIRDVTTSNIYL